MTLKSVLAGVVFIILVTTGVDFALHAGGVFPGGDQPLDDAHALLATAYRIVIGIAGVVVTWNLELGPRWYPVALAVLAITPCSLGGKLHAARRHVDAASACAGNGQ